ncbi:MAG: hypothetical protein WC889_07570 [Myxococcota bacterium]|jgi:hypothetical protein
MDDKRSKGHASFRAGGFYFRVFWGEAGVYRLEMDMKRLKASQDETTPPAFVSTMIEWIQGPQQRRAEGGSFGAYQL